MAATDSHTFGTIAELAVQRDLLARRYRVYALIEPRQHPDLWCLDKDDVGFSVEVRTVKSRGRKQRKPTDKCDVYAWVHRNGAIEYEPPLWQSPEPMELQ